MELDRVQRLILSNQYMILETLRPEDADWYAQARQALDDGYELEYGILSQYIAEDQLSTEECVEVHDILNMFSCLHAAYRDIDDKSGIDDAALRFSGFDGNAESKQLAYLRYTCEVKGYRRSFIDALDDLNSHWPMLEEYRNMLREWNRSDDPSDLTREDIRRIMEARQQ